MLIDITLEITPSLWAEAKTMDPSLEGHIGTHFDAMEREFPLEYTERAGIVFDVSAVTEREIGVEDLDLSAVERGMFVALYSGYIERVSYGEKGYFSGHPQLTQELIRALVERGVSIIGLDFGGVRRSPEHVPADRYCAEHGTFVVENLVNLQSLLEAGGRFIAHTYPLRMVGLTGQPCRVIGEI